MTLKGWHVVKPQHNQSIKNRTATIKKTKIISQESVIDGNNLCKYTSLGFSLLWFEPRSGHMWECQALLTDDQVVFPWILRFLPTCDERLAHYKQNILERAVKPKSNKFTTIGNNSCASIQCVSILYVSIVNNLCLSKKALKLLWK